MSLSRRGQLLCLIALCVLAYGRSLSLPLLEDDYPNITGARTWGTVAGFSTLIHTGLIVLRATGYWLIAAIWSLVGFHPLVYRSVSLSLHILNTLMILWLCRSVPDLRPAAFWAAAFFAIHEGHQEAVMWFSANNELLMLFFGLSSLWCWVRAFDSDAKWPLRAASLLLFALTLLSKESAVIFLPMFLLVMPTAEWRRSIPLLLPYALLTLGAVAIVISTRSYSFRFNDGSFSLQAPFWLTWPRSFARMLFIWGWIALAWIAFRKKFAEARGIWLGLAWIGLGLIPYSFLTYSTAIPSRQTYLASFGLAVIVGVGLADFAATQSQKAVLSFVIAVMLIHNVGYLWTKKHEQFAERAAPTEQLITLVLRTNGPVRVDCFPQPPIVAEEAVRVALGRDPEEALYSANDPRQAAAAFCYQRH